MRTQKPVTAERLEKSALAYLERFATSRQNLKRVLLRKLDRDETMEPDRRAALVQHIDGLMQRYEERGLLNDKVYAEGRVQALRRRGLSGRGIALKLQVKGVARDLAAETVEADETTDAEAALNFARRRRLGPFRPEDKRAEHRQRDMAAMGRAGFDYGTARGVIDGAGEDDSTL
jgi:regulatory protein